MMKSADDIKIYFVTIPAHKFLHIKNYESNGYWDFWQKQKLIPGQDCETICGLLERIQGELDDEDGHEAASGNGQIMAYINDPAGRLCDWGIPRIECYGIRLPFDYKGEVPAPLRMLRPLLIPLRLHLPPRHLHLQRPHPRWSCLLHHRSKSPASLMD